MTRSTPPELHVNLAIPTGETRRGGDMPLPISTHTASQGTQQAPLTDHRSCDPRSSDHPNATSEAAFPDQAPALPLSHPLDLTLLGIISELAGSRNRTGAIECLAHHLAALFPNAMVRCALGTSRMQRCYDQRLGWLRAPSALHADLQTRFDTRPHKDPTDAKKTIDIGQQLRATEQGVTILLPQSDVGVGCCMFWLDGVKAKQVHESGIIPLLPVLQDLLWKLPRFAIPAVVWQLGARAKWSLVVAATIVAVIAFWPTPYPIDCTARVEPVQQRLISAPFEATLLETHVRPGDEVSEGQPLVVLDGRPLRLELESTQADEQKLAKEHDVALATGRIAEAQQLSLQRQRLARRIELLTDRLHRLTVTSPTAGIVISGDLERFIGGTLELGQTLIEVAPMDSMAILIDIPEHEIGYVDADARVRVRMGSVGGPSWRSNLTDLYPAAEIRDDRNVFVGRILVDNPERRLRPGMQGKATTYGPLRPLAWSWVRGGWERLLWWSGY